MKCSGAPICGVALALFGAHMPADAADDPLHEAEMRELADLERLRAVNAGELVFIPEPATTPELHTQMVLVIGDTSLRDGWMEMRQCQSGLDGMQATEIVYRYAGMRALRVVRSSGIDQARVEGQSVQLRGVERGAEICVAAEVRILREVGAGRYRIVSGPYHRRFFDGYFPMRLSLEVEHPAALLRWQGVSPEAQPGYAVSVEPGRVAIDTRFTGMLTIELDFAQSGYRTPQPPSPQ